MTDSGPAYRPARNLYILRPPRPDGTVTALTHFEDGYVGEPELSWDASHRVHPPRARRSVVARVARQHRRHGADSVDSRPVSPCRARVSSGRADRLRQQRLGIRDEYHGYPCTVLVVMDADGTNMHPIATNIGRDNEPAVLHDGRIVFSRLEVFYSRNKTELTLHAAHPDGTQDVVLYGPERRVFWRSLDHGPPHTCRWAGSSAHSPCAAHDSTTTDA